MNTEQTPAAEDVEALKTALATAQAELAAARAQQSDDQALIAHLKLQIAKLNRERFGPHAERTARLLDQMELQLEELEASATSDEIAAETAAAKTTTVAAFTRKRPARKPFPEHLPRERVIVPGPGACLCVGPEEGPRLADAYIIDYQGEFNSLPGSRWAPIRTPAILSFPIIIQ